jgi:hypothetical protein
MKNTRYTGFLPFLLAFLTFASSTMAQTMEPQRTKTGAEVETEKDTRSVGPVAAARSKYTKISDTSPDASNPTLAQLRGGPERPFPSQRAYPRGTYQTAWADHGNAGHILIGAAIGFGVGAALGANSSARNGSPVSGGIVIGGGLFGFLGGCVGKAVGDLQGLHFASARHRRTSRPSAPEDDEESELAQHPHTEKTHKEASVESAVPSQPAILRALEL